MTSEEPLTQPSRIRRFRWVLWSLGVLLGLSTLLLVVFELTKGPTVPSLPDGIESGTAPFVTIFLVDGLSQHSLEDGLRTGVFPNMSQCIRSGAYIENGIGAFPSMTGYAFYPFLTGEDATRSGILGLRWFDRKRGLGPFRNYVGRTYVEMNRDIRDEPELLFEELLPQYSSSFNSYVNRGSVRQWGGGFSHTMAKYGEESLLLGILSLARFLDDELAPDWRVVETQVVDEAVADLALKPKLQWITFSSPDGDYHVHGDATRYQERLEWVDEAIGRYMEATRRIKSFDDRIFLIISDHGVVSVRENIDPRTILQEHGLTIFRGAIAVLARSELTQPLSEFDEVDGVLAINGNTMAYLSLKHPERGWQARPDYEQLTHYSVQSSNSHVDVIEALLELPGVEMVMARDKEKVRLRTRDSEATISRSADGYIYEAINGDPLAYHDDAGAGSLLDGRPHSREAWLQGTAHTQFAFAPVRLFDLLSQDNAGDIIITSREGYDFAPDYEMFVGNYRGGHGGIRADQLRVPYVLCGRGVRPGVKVNVATAEDVGATLRSLLGLPLRPSRAGRPLEEVLPE